MASRQLSEQLRRWEIPGRVACSEGNGSLQKLDVRTEWSAAEIYLHGGQITHFQKNGEKPLLFCSQLSRFHDDSAIRGGVPIIFPWFGAREGHDVVHGFARLAEWELHESVALPEGGVTLRFHLPETPQGSTWPPFSLVFIVTITDKLKMDLVVTNNAPDAEFTFENCLHTYFAVGDISSVVVKGLKNTRYLDRLENDAEKNDVADQIEVKSEIDRTYLDASGAVEILDVSLKRRIRIEKTGAMSTVVWNPWVGRARQMSDFADDEYKRMLCVESGNVARNKLSLAPAHSSLMSVTLSSAPL
jgi:glucose-6-phosphate 1-epimerase